MKLNNYQVKQALHYLKTLDLLQKELDVWRDCRGHGQSSMFGFVPLPVQVVRDAITEHLSTIEGLFFAAIRGDSAPDGAQV